MAGRPVLPDLTPQWRPPEPLRDPTWWECTVPGCLSATRGLPPSTICPERVIRWGAEQRTAGAAETRARIVAWLRTRASNRYEQSDVCNYVGGNTTAAYAKATEAEAAADAIERGEDRTP